jgi:hypothetical protein
MRRGEHADVAALYGGPEVDSTGVIVLVLAYAAVGITFYLRKNLAAHGFHLWIYAGVPLTAIMSTVFVLAKDFPSEQIESLFYYLGTIAMGVVFIGALIPILKMRKEG